MQRKIDDSTLAILSSATIEGNTILLNSGQLEREHYLKVNKVLEAMGGKWNRKVKGHIFDSEPTEQFESLILTGEYDTPTDYGYYPTPPGLVDEMITLANLSPDMLVLEPSAGRGAIVEKITLIVKVENVHCYELLPENSKYLSGYVQCRDFLGVSPNPIYDRVIMNPPFSKQQDIDHVTHALKFLKAGGMLVSIMSSGITFRRNKKTMTFLELIDGHKSMKQNPPESFRLSGTLVNTVTIVIEA